MDCGTLCKWVQNDVKIYHNIRSTKSKKKNGSSFLKTSIVNPYLVYGARIKSTQININTYVMPLLH